MTFQDVILNNGGRWVDIGQGDLKVYVFRGTPDDINDFDTWCPFLSSATLLAEGYASATSAINDLWYTDTNNVANSALAVNGELLSLTNEKKHFAARVLFSYDKEEEFNSLLDIVVSVTVQLN
jgi:hypothetical protein